VNKAKPKRQPCPDDLQLFREAVADARPLRVQQRVDNRPSPPAPRPRQREADERAVLEELLQDPGPEEGLETGEELLFLRSGYQKRYLNRLRRGHYAISDDLDLHGMNEASAMLVLREFISAAVASGQGCVRVVHGKGLRSRGLPKLKLMTARLLRRHPAVIAYASCRPVDGGTGAVSVLLKTRPAAAR
jgi:DNA-nicking Smr family endonuclease